MDILVTFGIFCHRVYDKTVCCYTTYFNSNRLSYTKQIEIVYDWLPKILKIVGWYQQAAVIQTKFSYIFTIKKNSYILKSNCLMHILWKINISLFLISFDNFSEYTCTYRKHYIFGQPYRRHSKIANRDELAAW